MQKAIEPPHFISTVAQQKMSVMHREIGKASSTRIVPILALITFILGLISGVIFTNTVQQEDQQFNSKVIEGLKNKVHLQQEQVKLGGLIMQMNSEPNNLSLKTEAVETLDQLNRMTRLNLFRQGASETEVIIEGQTYVLPFSWQQAD